MNPPGATSAARFLPLSTEVADAIGPGPLRHVETTGSTNSDLADEARRGVTSGAVLVADHQTAGRGRLDRSWEDLAGSALLVSLRIPTDEVGAPADVRAVGAAARAAADAACAAEVRAKWPNDLVVVDGPAPGKLAGVLAEFVAGDRPCVVVGVGVNLRPLGGQPGATSIAECGGDDDRDRLLGALLTALAARRDDPGAVLDELRRHSATVGTRVRVELPGGRELLGRATALTDDGALAVRDEHGREHVVSTGDVIHLRPA